MDKPSWNDAPQWAFYLVRDTEGKWWWMEDYFGNGSGWDPTLECFGKKEPAEVRIKPSIERRL